MVFLETLWFVVSVHTAVHYTFSSTYTDFLGNWENTSKTDPNAFGCVCFQRLQNLPATSRAPKKGGKTF
jgi:hypothetical protein